MADGKIYITISDKPLGDGGSGGGTVGPDPDKEKKKIGVGKYVEHELFHFVKEQAENMVNYTIGNIGNFTGDYQTQREIQNVINIANKIKGVAITTYFGVKAGVSAVGTAAGGVAGGIVGAVIAIGAMTINFGLSEYANQIQYKKMNYEITQMRKLSGQNVLLDGSRGTLE